MIDVGLCCQVNPELGTEDACSSVKTLLGLLLESLVMQVSISSPGTDGDESIEEQRSCSRISGFSVVLQ